MTVEELIAIARRYHPRPGPSSEYESDEDYTRALDEAPETGARNDARDRAMAREGSWVDYVRDLRAHVPPGWQCWGNTLWLHDNSYGAVVFRVNGRETCSVKVFESIFAPLYLIVELHVKRDADGYHTTAELHEPGVQTCHVWALIQKSVERRGVRRIPPDVAAARVPDVVSTAGLFEPGAMTLADALFTERIRDC